MMKENTCKRGRLQKKPHGCLVGSKQKQKELFFPSLQGSQAVFALIVSRCWHFICLCTTNKECYSLYAFFHSYKKCKSLFTVLGSVL